MAEILSGARKYGLGLILAQQELQHLARDREVSSAVLNNAATRICFRVGDDDAKKLAEGFATFEAAEIRILAEGEAIVRIERSDADFNLKVPLTELPSAEDAARIRKQIVAESRTRYGTPRSEVEPMLVQQLGLDDPEPEPPPAKSRTAPRPTAPPAPQATPTPEPATSAGESSPTVPVQPDPKPVAPEPPVMEALPEPSSADTERRHERIKTQILRQAESLDYTVTAEEKVPGTEGRADLVLRRGNQTIACEISVTTTADHEAANARKCLQGNYTHVAVISSVPSKLNRIRQLLAESLSADAANRVGYYGPEEFITHLFDRAAADPTGGETEKGKPRKQTFHFNSHDLTPKERQEIHAEMLKRLAATMRAKREGD